MKLILASNSPRRRELLSKLNYKFDVVPSDCDESTTAQNPRSMVTELACCKALDVFKSNPQAVVIGCDTVVDLDGKVLGKPHSVDEAVSMLKSLSNRQHKVHTGVCVISQKSIHLFAETSSVTFDKLSDERIRNYVATGSPMDKAGAYGIQASGFVSGIVGSYDNVMGLPTEKLFAILKNY